MFSKVVARQLVASRVAVRCFSTQAADPALKEYLANYDKACNERKQPILVAFPHEVEAASKLSNFVGVTPLGQLVFKPRSKGPITMMKSACKKMGDSYDNATKGHRVIQFSMTLLKWIIYGFFVPYALANVTHPHLFDEAFFNARFAPVKKNDA